MKKMAKTRNISPVWERIERHAGEVFRQIRGAEFRYVVADGHLIPDRTRQQIPRSHFEKALTFVPFSTTKEIQHLRGPSYIFAVLMDPRIRAGEW
jgi:hypothetical protein